jgi:hypothetical protein
LNSTKRGAPGEGTPSIGDGSLGGGTGPTIRQSPSRPQVLWRDRLKVHPAAELFPLMSEAELKELGADIKKNGLTSRVVLWRDQESEKDFVLDGRNRLDAMTRASLDIDINKHFEWRISTKTDPYEYVISANIHRRHLTAEQKRDLIGKLLKARPGSSNLQIAKQVKADDKTVASVRRELEGRSEIPNVEVRTDTKGRKQPAKKQTQPKKSTSPDCSRSGVSQVSTVPEKLTSGLPAGSDSSKTPVQQAEIAEPQTQSNPIIEAWLAGTWAQREEFIEHLNSEFEQTLDNAEAEKVENNLDISQVPGAEHKKEKRAHNPDIGQVSGTEHKQEKPRNNKDICAVSSEGHKQGEEEDADLDIPDYLKRVAP